MTLDDLFLYFKEKEGTTVQRKIAEKIGVPPTTLSSWIRCGRISLEGQVIIEALTKGGLKMDFVSSRKKRVRGAVIQAEQVG